MKIRIAIKLETFSSSERNKNFDNILQNKLQTPDTGK